MSSARRYALWLMLATAVAAVPRCWNIVGQHVEDYDGAAMALEGQLAVTVVEQTADRVVGRRTPWPTLPQLRGWEFTYAKPLHSLSLATGQLAGIPRTRCGPILSAVWGVVGVGLMFLLGRELWGEPAGLAAACCYGLSGFAAFYCRIAAAESFCFMWLILALWQYARVMRLDDEGRLTVRRTLSVGVLWSCVVLANYRLVAVTAVVLACGEALSLVRHGRRGLNRALLTACGLFVPMLLCEAAFRAANLVWSRVGGGELPRTYLQQFTYHLLERRSIASRLADVDWGRNLDNLFQYWRYAEGPWLPSAGAAGMLLVLAGRDRFRTAAGVYALSALIAALFWTRQDFMAPRVTAVLCVFLAPFAGFAVSRAAERFRWNGSPVRQTLTAAAYVGLLVLMVQRVGPDWFRQPSGFIGLDAAVSRAGADSLYAHWRQSPPTALFVVDRPIQQINDGFRRGKVSFSNMPVAGLLVAESDYVARHYPGAEVLHRFRLRKLSNELALAEDLHEWNVAVDRCRRGIEIQLVRINGPAVVEPASP